MHPFKPFKENLMNKITVYLVPALLFSSTLAHASVESSLEGLKVVLLGSILPIFAVLGLGFAAFSFFTGNPNAKQHLIYAVTGSVILFGAQSIVDLVQRVVR
jgi:type IV secretory pathway VirB2 component (pilin)